MWNEPGLERTQQKQGWTLSKRCLFTREPKEVQGSTYLYPMNFSKLKSWHLKLVPQKTHPCRASYLWTQKFMCSQELRL